MRILSTYSVEHPCVAPAPLSCRAKLSSRLVKAPSRIDKCTKQRRLLGTIDQALGMPLHAEDKVPVERLEALHRPVARATRDDQAIAELCDGLVVKRVHLGSAPREDPAQLTRWSHAHPVREPRSRLLLAMANALPDDVGQVLMKRSPASHVEQLQAAANGQYRKPAGVGRPRKRQLKSVELTLGRSGARVALVAVGFGIEVWPPERHTPATRASNGSMQSTSSGGTTTGMPPADSIARRYFSPRAISCCGGSPWGVNLTASIRRTSEVVTAISGGSPG